MKLNTTLLLLSLLGTTSAIAQPTLTALTSNPPVGLSMQLFQNTNFSAGTTGPNQVWDFSSQTFTGGGSESYQACSSINNCSTFPGTTVVGAASGGYVYLAASSSALSYTGVAAGGVNIAYSNTEDYFHYPMTYNSSFVDAWGGMFINMGQTFYRGGTDSVSADSWGSLKTPAGTYTNTLRVKRVQTYRDSANINGSSYIISYKATIYAWYDAAHKDFLYAAGTLSTTPAGGSANVTNYSQYSANQNLGITATGSLSSQWTVSPNPSVGNVNIAIDLPVAQGVSAMLIDYTGRTVRAMPTSILPAGKARFSIDASGLPAGIYVLRLTTANATDSRRIMIAD